MQATRQCVFNVKKKKANLKFYTQQKYPFKMKAKYRHSQINEAAIC